MPDSIRCAECNGRAILVNTYYVCQECGYHEEGPDEYHEIEFDRDDDDWCEEWDEEYDDE